ncbi:MAG TPA: hypothetical protein VEC16_03760 [Alphaproteobacteria bacterium]|nr:hypothetical protein [Alphaproteobacteria bacterium]
MPTYVNMEPRIKEKSPLEFMLELDLKLRSTKESHGSGAWINHVSKIDQFHSQMDENDIHNLLYVLDNCPYAFYPKNVNMGFSVGFELRDPLSGDVILKFKESQLPEGYDFAKMSEYFMKPKNVSLVEHYFKDVEIENRRSKYTY